MGTLSAFQELGRAVVARSEAILERSESPLDPTPAPLWFSAVYGPAPYVGYELAVWSERMDSTNGVGRAWPRGLAMGDVLASQGLLGLRLGLAAAAAAAASPGRGGGGWQRTDLAALAVDKAVQAPLMTFMAPRLLQVHAAAGCGPQCDSRRHPLARFLQAAQRLWADGIPGAPLSVYPLDDASGGHSSSATLLRAAAAGMDAASRGGTPACAGPDTSLLDTLRAVQRQGGGPGAEAVIPRPIPPVYSSEADAPGFNGMLPGIEQTVQRPAERLPSAGRGGGAGYPSDAPAGARRTLRFLVWNIGNGGGLQRARRRRLEQRGASEPPTDWAATGRNSSVAGRGASSTAGLSVDDKGEKNGLPESLRLAEPSFLDMLQAGPPAPTPSAPRRLAAASPPPPALCGTKPSCSPCASSALTWWASSRRTSGRVRRAGIGGALRRSPPRRRLLPLLLQLPMLQQQDAVRERSP